MKAIWNNEVIAESNETIVVEGNHYFPPDSVKAELLLASNRTSVCPIQMLPGIIPALKTQQKKSPVISLFGKVCKSSINKIEVSN